MKTLIKVETLASEWGSASSYYLTKIVEWDTNKAPVPTKDDTVYIDGVFIDVRRRCITSPDSIRLDKESVEIFASVDMNGFDQLENEGWRRE